MTDRGFTVGFLERDFTEPATQPQVSYVVDRYSWSATGGPKEAFITAYGDENNLWRLVEKLREYIIIQDWNSESVWWGYIHDIAIRFGNISVSISLDNTFNYIAVAYVEDGTRATTAYSEDTDSTGVYGRRELLLSMGDARSADAVQARDTKLVEHKYPIANIEPTMSQGEEGSMSARLICRGLFDTLDWRYYEQLKGLVAYTESGVGQQKTGLSYTASTIFFSSASFGDSASPRYKYEIGDTACGLKEFEKDDWVRVTGITNSINDGRYLATEGTRQGDDLTVEQAITGTASNSGSSFRLVTACGLFQGFVQSSGSAWNMHEIQLRTMKVGDIATAGGSGLMARVLEDSGGSPTTTIVATGSLASSDIAADMSWHTFTMDASAQLGNGSPYWIQVQQVGTPSGSAFYTVDVNEELGYTNGTFEISDGVVRHKRAKDADMLFRVIGKSETTVQLEQIVQGYSEFFRDINIENSSSVMAEQFRVGDTTSRVEFAKILERGTINDRRLLAEVTVDRRVRIWEESAKSGSKLAWTTAGYLEDQFGNRIPKQKCTVGHWAKLKDVIPGIVNLDAITDPNIFFIQENEYHVQADQLIPRARHALSPWDLGEIEIG